MSEPIYCGLAFGSVSIGTQGEIRPCCGIIPENWGLPLIYKDDHIKIKINDSRLREVRRNLMDGVWHPACYSCRDNEKLGIASMRTVWNRSISQAPMTEFIDTDSVKFLDLSVGNKCNSKCMTCGPGSSTLWIEEDAYIFKKIQLDIKEDLTFDDALVSELAETFKNIEYISFIGGEPIIIDAHYNFLKYIVDKNLSQKININYVTNLTGLNEDLIEVWKKFKSVGACVSIDGYSDINDYIRYPIKFEKVEQNLRRYMDLINEAKFGITLSCTVSIFNYNYVSELLDFFANIVLEYRNKNPFFPKHKVAVYLNRVTNSPYFNLNILSEDYRKEGVIKINKLKDKFINYDLHESFVDSCELLESWGLEKQDDNKQLIQEAIYFINRSDSFRKRSILNYIPRLWFELEKLNVQNHKS